MPEALKKLEVISPATAAATSASKLPINIPLKTQLWEHQTVAINRAANRIFFGLFFEMGTGKTLTAITILRLKYQKAGALHPTLILGPPIVLHNWRREILEHSAIKPEKIVVLEGSGKQRLKTFRAAQAKFGSQFIAITNYETLLMEPCFLAFYHWRPQCLVVDESHRCKDISAKRTRAVIQLADRALTCKLLLTGTPVLKSPLDLFAQYRIMDGGENFGTSYTSFRRTYFYDRNAGLAGTQKYFPDWQPRKSCTDDLNHIINISAMAVKKVDCLDLPPFVRKLIPVELSPIQKKLYREIKNDLITTLGDKFCTAPIALTKALRLQQIVSGYLPVEDKHGEVSNVTLKDNPRAAVLQELLAGLVGDHKVLVWAVFKENYMVIRRVLASLAVEYVEVTGEISASEKQKNVDRFNTDSRCRVLLGHPGSGGIGINLVAASYAVFYSRGFSLEHDLQAEARNYRGGSERHASVTRVDLVAEGTIDEIVLKALSDKKEMGDKLLREVKDQL